MEMHHYYLLRPVAALKCHWDDCRSACRPENTYVKNRTKLLSTSHSCVQHRSQHAVCPHTETLLFASPSALSSRLPLLRNSSLADFFSFHHRQLSFVLLRQLYLFPLHIIILLSHSHSTSLFKLKTCNCIMISIQWQQNLGFKTCK